MIGCWAHKVHVEGNEETVHIGGKQGTPVGFYDLTHSGVFFDDGFDTNLLRSGCDT